MNRVQQPRTLLPRTQRGNEFDHQGFFSLILFFLDGQICKEVFDHQSFEKKERTKAPKVTIEKPSTSIDIDHQSIDHTLCEVEGVAQSGCSGEPVALKPRDRPAVLAWRTRVFWFAATTP